MSVVSVQEVNVTEATTDVPDQVVCGACEHHGHLATHLRESAQCLIHLRNDAQFASIAKAKDETFLVKATILLGGCPAPECPGGGNHVGSHLPDQCFEWYRIQGSRAMGWKGALPHKKTVKTKISQFLRNARRNRYDHSGSLISDSMSHDQSQVSILSEQDSARMNATAVPDQLVCVNGCFHGENLAAHLLQQPDCLAEFILQYLPTGNYDGQPDLAIWDLGNLLCFCPNPACSTDTTTGSGSQNDRARAQHIRERCWQYYQIEGANLFGWDHNIDQDTVLQKLRYRRFELRKSVRMGNPEGEGTSVEAYEEESLRMLEGVCDICNIKGPLPGQNKHKLVVTGGTPDSPEFQCLGCFRQEEKHMQMVQGFHEELDLLSFGKPGDAEMAIVAVRAADGRPILVPSVLKGEMESFNGDLPHNVSVLLPNKPGALDQLPEDLFDEAKRVSDALSEMTDFASRRVIADTTPTQMASLFWRYKQAEIKNKRLRMLESMKKTSKGEIQKRDLRTVFTPSRIPTFASTQRHCLVDTCPWSDGTKEKSSREIQGKSAVNGVVKTKVQMILWAIPPSKTPSLAAAPHFLNVAFGKLKALEKHIIKPSYSNYDLKVVFHPTEWRIYLTGYLYSKECQEINAEIATEVVGEDVDLGIRAAKVSQLLTVVPTVSLKPELLANEYDLRQDRATQIVQLALCYQVADQSEPLCLMDITTAVDHEPTQGELLMRARAAELGQEYDAQMDTYNAVLQICQTLLDEGFLAMAEAYSNLAPIERPLAETLGREEVDRDVVVYHCLLVRTTGLGKWTLKRACGESWIKPYIPRILEANKNPMEAEVCYLGEDICWQEENRPLLSLRELPGHFVLNWIQTSYFEFINNAMPSRGPKLTNVTSQPIVPVLAERNEKLTWRDAPEVEEEGDEQYEIFVNQRGQRVIRTTSDVRVLYEARPEAVNEMCLAQFASQYRLLKDSQQSRKAYDKILAEIDPDTGIGPNTMDNIAGDPGMPAPRSMKLRNSKYMVKRTRGDAALDLQFSAAVNKYINVLLFTPWRELESIRVHQEEPEETDKQRERRLALFPLSKFKTCTGESDEEEEEEL